MEEELEEQEEDIWIKIFSSAPSLSNIDITYYFNYAPRFDDSFSRNNLPKVKDGAYLKNLHDKKSKEAHWIISFIDRNAVVYFDPFGMEYISQEVLNKIRDKSITHSVLRIQDNDSIMCLFYCIAFIEYCLQEKLC